MIAIESWVLPYVLNAVWQVPLLFAASWCAARVVRRLGSQAEHGVWVTGLLAGVVVPACRVPAVGGLREVMGRLWDGGLPSGRTVYGVVFAAGTVGDGSGWHLSAGLGAVVLGAYLVVLLYAAGRLAWGVRNGMVLRRASAPLQLTGDAGRSWERCCRRFEVPGAVLASSAEIAGPVTIGVWRRMLLVPAGFMEETGATDREAALAHELAHMQRRDFAKNLLYEVLLLPLAFHPVVWLTRAQVAQSRELICDGLAAEAMGEGKEYARSLLRLAARIGDRAPSTTIHAIGIFDANILERRVMNLTMRRVDVRTRTRVAAGVVCAVLGVAACGTALALRMEVKAPPAAKSSDSKAKDDGAVTPPKIVFRKNPVYPAQARADKNTVNGPVVLKVVVGVDGMPENVQVVQSLREDYDRSALDAVREWRFEPGMKDGKAIEIDMNISVNFQIFP